MPKLLDLEISTASLAIRVILGLICAGIIFFIFYYLPVNLKAILDFVLSTVVPGSSSIPPGVTSDVLGVVVSPILPFSGLVLTVVTFLEIVMRGTRIYGPILIVSGSFWLVVLYIVFEGGNIVFALDQSLFSGLSEILPSFALRISIGLIPIMLIFMLPSMLTVTKGVVLVLGRRGQK
ncbi:MAG: hypothetical protein ABSF36_01830 [Candidatus Methanomethylicaceae archaeon]